MAIQQGQQLLTIDEFWEIAQRPENDQKRLELIDGAIVEMPPSSVENGLIAAWIIYLLLGYVSSRGLGYVSGPDTGYRLGANTVKEPDAAYISKVRAGAIPAKVFPVAPDLAVEVISPSETSREVLDKTRLYLQSGTKIVWSVDPETKTVDVYRLAENGELRIQTLKGDNVLDGGEALPGFSVKAAEIFSVLEQQ